MTSVCLCLARIQTYIKALRAFEAANLPDTRLNNNPLYLAMYTAETELTRAEVRAAQEYLAGESG